MPLLCQILECASALNQNPATTPLSIKISTTTIRYNTTSAHTLQILDAPLVLSNNTSEHIQVVQTPNAEQIKHDTWENKSRLYGCFTTNKGHMFDRKFAEHGVPERVCSAQGQCCGFLEHQTWFHSKKKKKKTWFHLLFQSAPKGVDYYYYFISHMRARVHTHPLLLYIDKDMHKWCKWVEPSFVSARCKKAEPLTSRAWFICWTSWALALED